jgi:hypothetical protein
MRATVHFSSRSSVWLSRISCKIRGGGEGALCLHLRETDQVLQFVGNGAGFHAQPFCMVCNGY